MSSRPKADAIEAAESRPLYKLDAAAKCVAGAVALLYVIGLLLTNIHLARLGLSDFQILRPRFVWVGLDYVVYLGAPLFTVFAPLFLLTQAPWPKARGIYVLVAIAVVVCILALVIVLGTGFHYFIFPPHKGRWVPCLGFWSVYSLRSSLYLYWFPFFTSMAVLLTFRLLRENVKQQIALTDIRWFPFFGKFVMALATLGAISNTVPYIVHVYPNVHFAVGGGQPSLVSIVTRDRIADVLPVSEAVASDGSAIPVFRGPFLLWHRDEEDMYIASVKKGENPLAVMAIQRKEVIAVRFEEAHAVFRQSQIWGVPPSVTVHLHKERDEQRDDTIVEAGNIEACRTRPSASTKPSNNPPVSGD